MDDVSHLLERQAGVVSRAQLVAAGVSSATIRRLLRRRELVLHVPGVYVDHTGTLTWLQEAWVAVLALWPAALTHQSALRAADGPGPVEGSGALHVAVDRTRSPVPPPGVRLHQLADLDTKVQWNLSPPRVRIEEAVLDVAAESRSEMLCVSTLADAVQARRTTATRLREALDGRRRIARRAFLAGVLEDIANGTCSVLEHGYLTRVERPHGLPVAQRQLLTTSPATTYRDAEYVGERVVVELDGRLFHDSARGRDADLERDLDTALAQRITVRLGWGQVFGRECATARKIGDLLQARGWTGGPIPCARCVEDARVARSAG